MSEQRGEAMRLVRGGLVVLGVVLLLAGAAVFLSDVAPGSYLGVAAWLAGAVVLHDGVVAMAVFGFTVLVRRADRVPIVVRAIVQGAVALVAVVALVAAPEIVKQAIGSANPSILPLDYAGNLTLFAAGVGVAAGLAVVVALIVTRRRRRPSPSAG